MPEANQEKIQTNYRQYNPLQEQQIYSRNQPQEKSNFHSEMSFVSLALGILGLILPLFSTLSIITGIAGLIQIHRTNLKGKWMALTGIILGVLGLILFLLAIFFGINFIQQNLIMVPEFEKKLAGMIM